MTDVDVKEAVAPLRRGRQGGFLVVITADTCKDRGTPQACPQQRVFHTDVRSLLHVQRGRRAHGA